MYGEQPTTVFTVLQNIGVERVAHERSLAAVPPERLQVFPGDKIRLTASLQYRGPATSARFYAALGNRVAVIGFNEWVANQVQVNFPQCSDWVTKTMSVDIDTTGLPAAENLDLYCKLREYTEAGYPEVDNIIDILGEPEFQDFEIVSYEKV